MINRLFPAHLQIADLSSEDVRLLRLALSDGELREIAWNEWRAAVNFDVLTTGCLLVPAAYHANADRPACSVVERMKGAFRKNWLLTQLLQERLQEVLQDISATNIGCVVGDDVPLALAYYPNPGTRPIYEVTLYCQRSQRDALAKVPAIAALRSAGKDYWHLTQQAKLKIRDLDASPAMNGHCDMPTANIPMLNATAQFWRSFSATRPQAILRMLDLGVLIRDHGPNIAWSAVEEQAVREGRLDNLIDVLCFAADRLEMDLPADVQALLHRTTQQPSGSKLLQQSRAIISGLRRRASA